MFGNLIRAIAVNHQAIEVWVGALCTIGIFSLLYQENKIYRFFEHLYIGLAAGYAIRTTWVEALYPLWWQPMVQSGQWWWFFALPAGLMFYLIYSRKYVWMARLIIGIFLGLSAGMQFQQFAGQYFKQIEASFKPIVPQAATATTKAVTMSGALNNLLFMAVLVCVILYFLFSFEHDSPVVRRAAGAGRWMLMISFGAIFGSTVMARMALLIDRTHFIITRWIVGQIIHHL